MKNNEEDMGIDLATFSKENEIAKFDDMDVPGWFIIVRLYIDPIRTAGGIILTHKTQEDGEFVKCVGLVVKMGPAAYKDSRYEGSAPWCKVGNWVTFPRHAGWKMKYKGLPVWVLQEDAVGPTVEDPRNVAR